ncbi:uncharacterized protein LOC120772576 isoform X2 [Bactrocera tryoni]|uniref:uncharacterized protein LOC120772576 isoform X2 n=1 Tax=Bactrocera tryoni TaxID=59916 RepID=UPI001A974A54|nr:uncharacterized protein LOC120772576 isoform X2 [Bactrocera tryoni]
MANAREHNMFCGVVLIVFGFFLFNDSKRILLSRLLVTTSEKLNSLPQPLFYYMSVGVPVAGCVAVLVSMVGFWASSLDTYCCLSLYFLSVVVLLLAQLLVCLAITLWPHCLGISLDESKMVKVLQGNYGMPGKEQFTNAIDLVQTHFGCCGINNDINYDTSLWKLQSYGQREWVVPLTCCILHNVDDKLSYLDPKPENITQCQMLQKMDYVKNRHKMPCLKYIENWYNEQYTLFLQFSLIIAIVEFCILLSVIVNCTKIAKKSLKQEKLSKVKDTHVNKNQKLFENIYEQDLESRAVNTAIGLNKNCSLPKLFNEVYIKSSNLHKLSHTTDDNNTNLDSLQ